MRRRSNIVLVEADQAKAGRHQEALAKVLGDDADIRWVQRLADLSGEGASRPDAIVVELPAHASLPELGQLKPWTDRVAVVVVSERYSDALAKEALRLGAQDYVVPRTEDGPDLARAVAFAIERHRLSRELLDSVRGDVDRSKAVDTLREISRLRQVSEFKTQLLNTAAHELSTPLTPVRFQTAILKASDLQGFDERQRKAIDILDRNVDRLSRLVHDVLDVARLESKSFKIDPQRMDLVHAAHEAADAFRELARDAGVTVGIEASAPIEINADPQRVSQVFFNLLSNAIKFTPSGGTVTVSVRLQGDTALATVVDTGVGLRPADFQKLFQPFSQIEDPDLNTPKRPGTGLGLYITQGIVEQHGGRIWCDSEGAGKGSTFAFALPLPRDPDEGPEHMAASPSRRGMWPFIFFHCPMCDSRDIDMRLLRNIYECNRCDYAWR